MNSFTILQQFSLLMSKMIKGKSTRLKKLDYGTNSDTERDSNNNLADNLNDNSETITQPKKKSKKEQRKPKPKTNTSNNKANDKADKENKENNKNDKDKERDTPTAEEIKQTVPSILYQIASIFVTTISEKESSTGNRDFNKEMDMEKEEGFCQWGGSEIADIDGKTNTVTSVNTNRSIEAAGDYFGFLRQTKTYGFIKIYKIAKVIMPGTQEHEAHMRPWWGLGVGREATNDPSEWTADEIDERNKYRSKTLLLLQSEHLAIDSDLYKCVETATRRTFKQNGTTTVRDIKDLIPEKIERLNYVVNHILSTEAGNPGSCIVCRAPCNVESERCAACDIPNKHNGLPRTQLELMRGNRLTLIHCSVLQQQYDVTPNGDDNQDKGKQDQDTDELSLYNALAGDSKLNAGDVYVIAEDGYTDDGSGRRMYKLGMSANVEKRVKQLQTGNPRTLVLLCKMYFPNKRKLESYLHRQFKNERRNGEWFSLTLENVTAIIDFMTV